LTHGPNNPDLDMRRLRSGVALEAEAGLLEQLGGHGEVALGVAQHAMSEIDRQVGQEPLDVLALAVPGDETNDREGMAEVVQSRLKAGIVGARYACLFTKPLEDELRCLARDGRSLLGSEKRSRLRTDSRRPLPFDVVAQHAAKVCADRDEAALEELGLADGQDAGVGVEIVQRETERFADPEAGSVEKQQECAYRVRFKQPAIAVPGVGGIDQPFDVLVGTLNMRGNLLDSTGCSEIEC
jgi:hypothetical protein